MVEVRLALLGEADGTGEGTFGRFSFIFRGEQARFELAHMTAMVFGKLTALLRRRLYQVSPTIAHVCHPNFCATHEERHERGQVAVKPLLPRDQVVEGVDAFKCLA